jgi:hypothetical protein
MERGVGMELILHDLHKAALQRQLQRSGGVLPDAPDGPILESFKALEFAQALEHELQRAGGAGMTKIAVYMNFNDAQELASYLRRSVLMGV